jgi:carbon storage regulator
MLVLSRQRDETIMIGDDIEVTVVDIRGDKVRLGISAPKEIAVHRKEVYEAIKRENREAARVKPEDLPNLGKVGPRPTGIGEKPASQVERPASPPRSGPSGQGETKSS